VLGTAEPSELGLRPRVNGLHADGSRGALGSRARGRFSACGCRPPMLSRSGPLPTGPDWSFEVKWHSFPRSHLDGERLARPQPSWLEHDRVIARAMRPTRKARVGDPLDAER